MLLAAIADVTTIGGLQAQKSQLDTLYMYETTTERRVGLNLISEWQCSSCGARWRGVPWRSISAAVAGIAHNFVCGNVNHRLMKFRFPSLVPSRRKLLSTLTLS